MIHVKKRMERTREHDRREERLRQLFMDIHGLINSDKGEPYAMVKQSGKDWREWEIVIRYNPVGQPAREGER